MPHLPCRFTSATFQRLLDAQRHTALSHPARWWPDLRTLRVSQPATVCTRARLTTNGLQVAQSLRPWFSSTVDHGGGGWWYRPNNDEATCTQLEGAVRKGLATFRYQLRKASGEERQSTWLGEAHQCESLASTQHKAWVECPVHTAVAGAQSATQDDTARLRAAPACVAVAESKEDAWKHC